MRSTVLRTISKHVTIYICLLTSCLANALDSYTEYANKRECVVRQRIKDCYQSPTDDWNIACFDVHKFQPCFSEPLKYEIIFRNGRSFHHSGNSQKWSALLHQVYSETTIEGDSRNHLFASNLYRAVTKKEDMGDLDELQIVRTEDIPQLTYCMRAKLDLYKAGQGYLWPLIKLPLSVFNRFSHDCHNKDGTSHRTGLPGSWIELAAFMHTEFRRLGF